MPPSTRKPRCARFSEALHAKFRSSVRAIRRQPRSPKFHPRRRAFYRLHQKRPVFLKGVHGIVEKAFGSLQQLIDAAGGCEPNQSRSRTATSRGSRVGKELCSLASSLRKAPTTKKLHAWTLPVRTALRRWGIYLIDGEVPVSKGHVATGVDLLGVCRDPTQKGKWQLVCIELKTGYKGPVWKASPLGATAQGVRRSVLNYALTQAQLTHECAAHTFKEYEFAPPLVVLVNDNGVKRFSPDDSIVAQCTVLV